jgi:ABC-type branched-subunit amino acid transport system ATPase component
VGSVLVADKIAAGYGAGDIIHGVSVRVEPGEVASIVGPNGSGKSTLLKSLVGILRISSGRVLVGDRDVTGLPPEEVARAGVGYVPQIDDVFAPLTVKENLEMGGYLLPSRQVSARVERVLEVFPRLSEMLGRRAGKLSGGMLLSDHVRRLAENGAAVLIVEQRARAVLAISDHTYVLGGGQLLMEGTPAELSASPEFVESFLGGGRPRVLVGLARRMSWIRASTTSGGTRSPDSLRAGTGH